MTESHPTFTFLLGSGVSCAAGLPNVQKLSCAVSSAVTGTEARLLEVIKDLSAAIHGDGRHSYEDWFFLADQLFQHESGDSENPGLLPLIERLRCSLGVSNDELMAIAGSLSNMIGDTVSRKLHTKDARPDVAFAGLVEAIREREGAKFRFFTLNHDTLLECFLRKAGIKPYTGLARHPKTSDYQRVRFSRAAFDEAAVSVVKLHGSVDWRRIRPMSSRTARNPSKGEFIGTKHPGGAKDFERMDNVPRVLIGTSNKILGYSTPVFLPLFAEFQNSLQESKRLLVCGYGFGDKGINTILIDWMSTAKGARMKVVDPEPFHPSRCRTAVLDKIRHWKAEKRLGEIRSEIGAGKLTWTEILPTSNAR